jgi:hypothetical protein
MIAAIVLYCLALATLVGFAAWALEQAAIRFGIARRFVWLVALLASCVVPAVMIAQAADQRVTVQSARVISMPLDEEPRAETASAPTSREPFEPNSLERMLESRYGGIEISIITRTPVTRDDAQQVKNASGEDLHLHSLWLDPGSPLPSA